MTDGDDSAMRRIVTETETTDRCGDLSDSIVIQRSMDRLNDGDGDKQRQRRTEVETTQVRVRRSAGLQNKRKKTTMRADSAAAARS
uniref:Uncharacterized protein n=1 Tax=Cucumis melo TaxID=3656 RepID=A0A9I9DL55_CUCME